MRNKRLHTRLARREQVSGFARFLRISRQGLYKILKQEKKNLWEKYILWMQEEVYMLGQKVYYLKMTEKDANVYDGIVVAEYISGSGHRAYTIRTKGGDIDKEKPYVYADKECAKAAFEAMWPKAKKMYDILNQAREDCDKIRNELLGKPEFPELAEEGHEHEQESNGNN